MDSIHIQGYKSIKEATIELRPINILIGGNGSGKSNFLSFFEFLNKLYERNLQEYVALNGGMEKMLHGGLNGAKAISSSIVFSKGISEFSFNLERGLVSFVFTEEDLRYINFHKKVATFDSESYAKRAIHDQNRTEHMVSQLEDLKKYHLNDTGKQSPFIQSSHIQNDSYFLYEDGRNIAAYLYSIKKNHSQHPEDIRCLHLCPDCMRGSQTRSYAPNLPYGHAAQSRWQPVLPVWYLTTQPSVKLKNKVFVKVPDDYFFSFLSCCERIILLW